MILFKKFSRESSCLFIEKRKSSEFIAFLFYSISTGNMKEKKKIDCNGGFKEECEEKSRMIAAWALLNRLVCSKYIFSWRAYSNDLRDSIKLQVSFAADVSLFRAIIRYCRLCKEYPATLMSHQKFLFFIDS